MAKFEYQPPSSAAAIDQKVPKNPLLQQQDANGLPPATIDALRTAAARAEANKLELLKSPEMLNGEDLSVELGLSRATVDNRRVVGKLLALEFGSKRGYRYPRWQRELLQEGDRRVAFEAALARLAGVGPWSRYRFFVQNSPALDGQTPVEALRAGQVDAVLRAADSWAGGEQGGG